MKSFVVLAVVALVLSGCLSKMEQIADDTKANVQKTYDLTQELHEDQQAGGAYSILVESLSWDDAKRERFRNNLINTSETLIKKARKNRVGKYVGAAPGDIDQPTTYSRQPDRNDPRRMTTIPVPVVSFVDDGTTKREKGSLIVPIHPILYDIFVDCIIRMGEQLSNLKNNTIAKLTPSELQEYKDEVLRFTHVGTIILGGSPYTDVPRILEDKNHPRRFMVEDIRVRKQFVKDMLDAIRILHMGSQLERELCGLAEGRMGFSCSLQNGVLSVPE